MPTFQYEAVNRSGQTQKGTIEAESNDEAMSKLKSKGFYPTSIRAAKAKGGPSAGKAKKAGPSINLNIGGVSRKKITLFSRQLSTLQDAGLPILRSIRILEEQQKGGMFRTILEDVGNDVEGGSALSESMAKHPKAFDSLYTQMIAAGEIGGVLDIILQRLAEYMEKAEALKRRIVGAMVYPAVIVFVAVLIVTGIMVFIIPKFGEIFADFGVPLPWPTQVMIDISYWIAGQHDGQWIPGWVYIVLSPFIIVISYKIFAASKFGKLVLNKVSLLIPVFGKLNRLSITSRMCRTLGTLVAAGVPILDSISIARDTVGNVIFESALQKVYDSIREGESFAEPLRQTKVVDLLVVNMIDVGEETGDLDKMLMKIADNYDDQVDNMVKTLMSLLEPMMIVFLGGIVLCIVAAIFMPLPHLISSVGSG